MFAEITRPARASDAGRLTIVNIDLPTQELAKTDLAGLHQQHAAAWSSFNTTLQIVILVEALPWATAGTLLARGQQSSDNLLALLHPGGVLGFVLLFTGLAGSVGYAALVYNRLTILFYAHAVNGYRALFADALPDIKNFLPVRSDVPPLRESSGIMFLLSWSLIALNAVYLGLAAYSLAPVWRLVIGLVIGAAVFVHLWLWYRRVTSRPVLPGSPR